MTQPLQPRLNQSWILRYDSEHVPVNGRSEPPLPDSAGRQQRSADMEVHGLGSVPQPIAPGATPSTGAVPDRAASGPVNPQDEVEISPAARMLDELNRAPEVRTERLAQIKAAIEAGTYETPEKLEAALGKLLDEIDADRASQSSR